MLDAETIINLIRHAIPDASVRIEDLRGDGEPHYAAWVSSPSFARLTRVEQHRKVYEALKGHLNTDIQALTLQTSVSEA
jgi:stress-induced morphogen